MLIDDARQALGKDYEITRELGRGGMAIVYDAYHRQTGHQVAIKILPPQLAFAEGASERFVREGRLSVALAHPGIVRVYRAGIAGDLAYLVMDMIHGESLARHLAHNPRLDAATVYAILHDVGDALGYAHSAGVIHRDVKPDNIILDAINGRPVLTDFGIARAIDDDARLTSTGAALGTPAYMSPEQAQGDREIDARSDIYSLGVVGYQLLTGRLAFEAANVPALLTKHLTETPVSVLEVSPDAPPEMAAAVERALAKNPDQRWPSAAAFQNALGTAPAAVAAPARTNGRPHLRGRRTAKGPRTEGVGHRIRSFQVRAVIWAGIIIADVVTNVIDEPGWLGSFALLWTASFFLGIRGAHLYAEDVSIRELFTDVRLHGLADDGFQMLPDGANRHNARFENAKREAEYNYNEIARTLRLLSRGERALLPGVGKRVEELKAHVALLGDRLVQTGLIGNRLFRDDG